MCSQQAEKKAELVKTEGGPPAATFPRAYGLAIANNTGRTFSEDFFTKPCGPHPQSRNYYRNVLWLWWDGFELTEPEIHDGKIHLDLVWSVRRYGRPPHEGDAVSTTAGQKSEEESDVTIRPHVGAPWLNALIWKLEAASGDRFSNVGWLLESWFSRLVITHIYLPVTLILYLHQNMYCESQLKL